MDLVTMGLRGSVTILVVALARLACKRWLPPRTFVILWTVAAFQLLVPWTPPSPVSIWDSLETAVVDAKGAGAAEFRLQIATAPASLLTTAGPAHPWSAVWIIGIFLCAGVLTSVYISWRRRFAMSLPIGPSVHLQAWLSSHRLRRRIQIRQSDFIDTPLTYGVFRPVILLPKGYESLPSEDLTLILTHEWLHIRWLDSATKLLFLAAACAHWANPLAWLLCVLGNKDMELACDAEVVRRTRAPGKYARLLIRMEEQRGALRFFCGGCSRNSFHERIYAIMKTKKLTLGTLIFAVALAVGISAVFACSPNESPELPSARSESVVDISDLSAADNANDNDPADIQDENAVLPNEAKTSESQGMLPGSDEAASSEVSVADTAELLIMYEPFGLTWTMDDDGIHMAKDGKPVHSVFDAQIGVYIANNMNGLDLGVSAVDLEAEYRDDRLVGLREEPHPAHGHTTASVFSAQSAEAQTEPLVTE